MILDINAIKSSALEIDFNCVHAVYQRQTANGNNSNRFNHLLCTKPTLKMDVCRNYAWNTLFISQNTQYNTNRKRNSYDKFNAFPSYSIYFIVIFLYSWASCFFLIFMPAIVFCYFTRFWFIIVCYTHWKHHSYENKFSFCSNTSMFENVSSIISSRFVSLKLFVMIFCACQ